MLFSLLLLLLLLYKMVKQPIKLTNQKFTITKKYFEVSVVTL